MPTQEPQHYWPFDKFDTEPAKLAEPEPLHDSNTVMPFVMTSGDDHGRDLLFETKFFSVTPEPDPKALPPQGIPTITNPALSESVTEKSLDL